VSGEHVGNHQNVYVLTKENKMSIMIIGVTTRSNRPVISLTYDGVSLTKIRHDNPGGDVRTELWYLIAPIEGTHTVNLTVEDTTTIEAGATTWTGVGQTAATALGIDAGATGLNTTASVDVASSSGEVVVDVVGTQHKDATVTVGAGQTERWNQVGTADVGAASSEPGATTVTMSWDLAIPESWAVSAAALLSKGGSFDPDGTIVSYAWKEGTTVLGTTASITKDFSVGTHTVTLTVTDNDGATGTDTMDVTVGSPSDTPPTVSIKSPADGATVSGIIDVTADATDDKGVTKVEFFVDGTTKIGEDTTAYAISWDTTVADGPHTITATATDTIEQTDSNSISVTVDNTPPTVSITSPADGATVSGTIDVKVDASDATSGVAQVEFFVNGASIGVDTNGDDGWSVSWDTTTVTNDSHTLTATATDAAGNAASDSVTVTVDNPVATTMHVGDLDGTTTDQGRTWSATVTITVHDANHNLVEGATVSGIWSGGYSGTASCTTDSNGQCSVTSGGIPKRNGSTTFMVEGVTHSSLEYDATANHDPDGDSGGTSITVYKP